MLSFIMYKRILSLDLTGSHSCFLWGPRQSGKSTLLAQFFPAATVYDLLQADVYRRLVANPSLLREKCLAQGLTGANQKHPVIIDEVQKLPELLDEAHWLIESPRFYFFDVGIAGALCRRGEISLGSELFGRAFEHFIFMELAAYCNYNNSTTPLSYWRTASWLEVDFILGEGQIALEAKATPRVHAGHLGGLRAFQEEHHPSRAIVVSLDPRARLLNEGIEVLPWKAFLNQLWSRQLV